MTHRTIACSVIAMALLAGGCGSATLVERSRHGGEVALDGPYMMAIGEARALMAEHCHGRFAVAAPELAHSSGNATAHAAFTDRGGDLEQTASLRSLPTADQKQFHFVCLPHGTP